MKNNIFFSLLLLVFGAAFLTSCNDDDTMLPDPNTSMVECDSFVVMIDLEIDSAGADLVGTLTAVPLGGVETYTYLWNTGETTASIEVTEEDEYAVTVTDLNDCTATGTIDYEGLLIDNGGNGDSTACDGFLPVIYVNPNDSIAPADYAILAADVPTGGTAPYSYEWNTGETTQEITVTDAGTYTVLITDAAGCSGTAQADYAGPLDCSNFEVTLQMTSDSSGMNSIILYTSLAGGQSPYSYEWSDGSVDSQLFLDEGTTGTFSVTVTDANNCEDEDDITL